MRRPLAVLLACLAVSACGGGGAPAASSSQQNPPPPNDVTAAVVAAWADRYETTLQNYETSRQNTEARRSADGTFSSGAHYEDYRDRCIGQTDAWATGAMADLQAAERGGTTDRAYLSDLVEDYRQDFLDYMLASYDYFHQRAGANENVNAQIRQEIIDGINAVFDDLQGRV